MSNPTVNQLHVDTLLVDTSIAVVQAEDNFVFNKVLPLNPVKFQSDKFAVYNAGDIMRNEMQPTADGAESPTSGWRISDDTYRADAFSLQHLITARQVANADAVFDLRRDATTYLTMQSLINREVAFFDAFFDAAAWDVVETGVAAAPGANQFLQWDQANSTPIEDIRAQITAIGRTGVRPNILILGAEVADILIDNAQLVDRVKYGTQAGEGISTVDLPELAKLFNVERVLRQSSVQNLAAEGVADNLNYVNSKSALLMFSAPSVQRYMATAGMMFEWTVVDIARTRNRGRVLSSRQLDTYPAPWKGQGAEYVRIFDYFDMKVVASSLGVLFESAVV